MLINAPVYTMENNTHFVIIYTETDDGTFKRTQDEPLRLLRDDIAGVSMSQGELISTQYDRHDRSWNTATVSYHYGKPQSFYAFLRSMVARNKFFVFSKPVLSGHLVRFDVHELKLKSSASQRKISLLKEKYVEAIDLWSEEEHERHHQKQILRLQQKAKLIQGRKGSTFSHHSGQGQVAGVKAKPAPSDIGKGYAPEHSARKVVPLKARSGKQVSKQNSNSPNEGQPDKNKQAATDLLTHLEGDNPFAKKSLFRHNHFIRRFIFNRS